MNPFLFNSIMFAMCLNHHYGGKIESIIHTILYLSVVFQNRHYTVKGLSNKMTEDDQYKHTYGKHQRIKVDYEKDLDLKKYQITDQQIKDVLTKLKNSVDPERAKWLKQRPWWTPFHSDFQTYLEKQFPGTHVVAHIDPMSASVLLLINTIQIPCAKYTMIPMEQSACHENSEKLFLINPKLRIFTGYALSADGMWRHHSWVTDEHGVITETTEPRLIYIGYDRTAQYAHELSNVSRRTDKFV